MSAVSAAAGVRGCGVSPELGGASDVGLSVEAMLKCGGEGMDAGAVGGIAMELVGRVSGERTE